MSLTAIIRRIFAAPSDAEVSVRAAASALGRHGAETRALSVRQTYDEFHNRLRAERDAGFPESHA